MSAIASGGSLLIAIDRRVARTVADRNPGLLRKLTVVVSLADADSYEGGDFMLEVLESPPDAPERRLKTLTEVRQMGAALIFPAHLYHQVTPVTAGRRRSLVAWFLGPPFV